ncbi:hypothetical protein CCY99_06390 [Helicobacter sp. 16-1353]|uniref:DUF5644 domain-containing protein n=1 Tax=Helicobacter sp. 16-1353 TaxID=2004996 RepID=UPI000DCE0C66|nr:DUF5644 domain-containing protein [Helicobacter sp. 16-1353]RAX52993.1 hypothetical protein CCY99_06390 [Helicobacter sp. 16-1353]
MDFKISVFRFNANTDYNEYYQSIDISIDENLNLKDLLIAISKSLDDFSYDDKSFGFRINNIVVFSNIKLLDLKSHFGTSLIITPISTKYAMKDLIIDKEAIYSLYKTKLDKFKFLSEESKNEFKKYILINLISPLDLDDYVGDGYCLYIKWMMIHYKDYAKDLLMSIARYEDGVMNSISVKNMIYPPDGSIDKEIEGLQRMLLQSIRCPIRRNHWVKIAKKVESLFKLTAGKKLNIKLKRGIK